MLVATIQNVELGGILSVTAETIKFVPSNETSMGVRVTFDTVENTIKFVVKYFNSINRCGWRT